MPVVNGTKDGQAVYITPLQSLSKYSNSRSKGGRTLDFYDSGGPHFPLTVVSRGLEYSARQKRPAGARVEFLLAALAVEVASENTRTH